MQRTVLITTYLLLVSLPLLASWYYVGQPRIFWQELGSVLGILSFAMILSEFVLSGRVKSFSRKVGMDTTMRFHRIIGWCALVAALIHPFLYSSTPTTGPWPWDSTRQYAVTAEFTAISTGVLAFVLLPVLVVLAVWRSSLDYHYETWRRLHGLIAAALVGLLLHHTLTAGRYAANESVAVLWQILSFVALLTLIYRYFIAPLFQVSNPWRVSAIEKLSNKQWKLSLEPEGGRAMDYQAGQFAWLKLRHSAFSIRENPFSIASAPAQGSEISFVIKELGDFTSTLGSISVGERAYIDGPYGSLTVDGRSEPGIALIAGGVGIAPMLGIASQLQLTNDPRKLKVIYANRSQEQIVCREQLDAVDTLYVLSEPSQEWVGGTGIVDQQLIESSFTQEQFDSWLFVVCGPVPMMDAVWAALIAKGVPQERILLERFNYD